MKKLSCFTTVSVLLGLTLIVSACDDKEFRSAYQSTCVESKTIPFDNLTAASTCNGVPIIFAISKVSAPKIQYYDAINILGFLKDKGVNITAVDPATGKNALMFAIENNNYPFSYAFLNSFYSDENRAQRDKSGATYLHYLARTRWTIGNYDWLFSSDIQNVIDVGDNAQRTAIQIAYDTNNFQLVWELIAKGANYQFINSENLKVDFLFSPLLNEYPSVLDQIGGNVRSLGRGEISRNGEDVNFTLLHYAIDNDLHKLFNYLLNYEVSLTRASARGTPLQIALQTLPNSDYADILLKKSEVLQSPDLINVITTNMPCGDDESVNYARAKSFLSKSWPLNSYKGLFANCRDSSGAIATIHELFLNRTPRSVWQEQSLTDYLDSPREYDVIGNSIGQNYAHYVAMYFPAWDYPYLMDMQMKLGRKITRFDLFLEKAEPLGVLSKKDVFGMTPAHYWLVSADRKRVMKTRAESKDEVYYFQKLLKASKLKQELTMNNDSILSLAVSTGNVELVKAVFDYDVKMKSLITVRNKQGKTPKDMADQAGYQEISAYLKKKSPSASGK
jgi:ankyrin repeat protein